MKLADYSKVRALKQDNIFLLDGPDGTKTILASDLANALIGLLTSEEFIGGVDMAELELETSVLEDNAFLIGTEAGNRAVKASVLAKKLVKMLTSSELVAGLNISELTETKTLSAGDYLMAGLSEGNRAVTAKDLSQALIGLLTSQEFISGLKMNELAKVTDLTAGDNILVGTSAGNKYMKADEAMFAMLDAFAAPELHRMIFRGKNLGAALTTEQKANIQNGTFKGLWLGDYWVIGGVTWRIADIDYWYNQGGAAFTMHHLVIMPDTTLYNAKMNDTNTTEGGYVGSAMYKTNLEQAKTTIASAFGSAVLTHREYLSNGVTNGRPSAGSWYDSSVELPNEIMMYGSYVFSPANDGANIPMLYTTSKTQLALMQAVPKFINPSRQTQWLRDVVSAVYFARVNSNGLPDCISASGSYGVRPAFPIG